MSYKNMPLTKDRFDPFFIDTKSGTYRCNPDKDGNLLVIKLSDGTEFKLTLVADGKRKDWHYDLTRCDSQTDWVIDHFIYGSYAMMVKGLPILLDRLSEEGIDIVVDDSVFPDERPADMPGRKFQEGDEVIGVNGYPGIVCNLLMDGKYLVRYTDPYGNGTPWTEENAEDELQ